MSNIWEGCIIVVFLKKLNMSISVDKFMQDNVFEIESRDRNFKVIWIWGYQFGHMLQ